MKYTLVNMPEMVIEVSGKKDTGPARKKAVEKLLTMLAEKQLEVPEGFTMEQLIPVGLSETGDVEDVSDPIVTATEVVRQFAKLKVRLEKTVEQARVFREVIVRAFEDEKSIGDDDISAIESGADAVVEYIKALKEKVALADDVEQARVLLQDLFSSSSTGVMSTVVALETEAVSNLSLVRGNGNGRVLQSIGSAG